MPRLRGPAWVERHASPRVARVHHRLPHGEVGAVALTFDDGPDPDFTPQVLDVLRDAGAPATFFFVGARATAHPDLVRRAVAEGHAVGSHSHTHARLDLADRRLLRTELRRGRRAVEQAAGRTVHLFRPPRGHLDLRSAVAMRAAGLSPWFWTLDTEDWRAGAAPGAIAGRAAEPQPRDVVLLHDGLADPEAPIEAQDRSATVAALAAIIAAVRARDLALVTLPR